MLLYTAYGEVPAEHLDSVAQRSGLERYLGYRPHFCSLVNPDSLVDTWFRVFAASPRFVQVIDVYEVDAAQAVPMDVVAWCGTCFGVNGGPEPNDDTLIEATLNADHPDATDYIVPFDVVPTRTWRFDVLDILNGKLDGLGLTSAEQSALQHSMERVRALQREHGDLLSTSLGQRTDQLSLELWYRLMVAAGLVPFVWSQVLGRKIAPELLRTDPWALMRTPGYRRAQEGIIAWDRSLGTPGQFGHADFEAMRNSFVAGCDQLAHQLVETKAARAGTARNGTCFCGSGKKYKKCCMRKGLDALARDW
ncbi:MAG: SEC-C domain-containing protein [Coriobacteriales bacterium]|nr:SEC-C domain-containing protein [Coriobacteriales bacterium]